MHRYFADWYRIAAIEPQPGLLEKRWDAVRSVVEALDVARAFEVVRIFLDSPRTDPQFLDGFRDAFKARDVTFPMRDNDTEIRVLAGAVIISLLDTRRGPVADVAALATVAGDCRGLRRGERISDMLRETREYLLGRSAGLRRPRTSRMVIPRAPDVEAILEPLQSALQARQTRDPNFEGLMEPLHPPGRGKQSSAFEMLSEAIQTVAAAVTEAGRAAAQAIDEQAELLRLQREEANILWWLFAEYSRDLDHRMADLQLPAVCLVGAKELADLTESLPGPLAAAGVLDKMLRAVEPDLRDTTTIQEAVNAAPRAWRLGWAQGGDCDPVEDLCPVLFAARRALDTDGPDDWIAPVRKVTGVDVLAPIKPLDLAMQMYEERLLAGALRQPDEHG